MNEIQVTVRGNVTSDPRQIQFDDGNIVTSFRLASNTRRYDYQNREWVNTGTTFMNVNCRRGLATNAAKSLVKGQPVLVTGKLRERTWESNGRAGRSLEVEADGLGHDLSWGTSDFTRVVRVEQVRSAEDEQAARMAMELARDEESIEADGLTIDPVTGEVIDGFSETSEAGDEGADTPDVDGDPAAAAREPRGSQLPAAV